MFATRATVSLAPAEARQQQPQRGSRAAPVRASADEISMPEISLPKISFPLAPKLKPVANPYLDELVGAMDHMGGVWDPAGLATGGLAGPDGSDVKRFREAEITHGRVAMLATVGVLFGESFPLLNEEFAGDIDGPAIFQGEQVPSPFWELTVGAVMFFELARATKGWVDPKAKSGKNFDLKPEYKPGELGFDPLNLWPGDLDPEKCRELQLKELNNGRLAMISIAGMVAQEVVTKQPIFPEEFFAAPGDGSISGFTLGDFEQSGLFVSDLNSKF